MQHHGRSCSFPIISRAKKTFQLYEVYFVITLFCTALGMTMVRRLSGWWMVASERSYSRFVENESAHDLCPVQPAGERLNICLYNYSSNNSWWSKKNNFWAGTSSIRQEVVTLKQQNNPSVHVRVERHTWAALDLATTVYQAVTQSLLNNI